MSILRILIRYSLGGGSMHGNTIEFIRHYVMWHLLCDLDLIVIVICFLNRVQVGERWMLFDLFHLVLVFLQVHQHILVLWLFGYKWCFVDLTHVQAQVILENLRGVIIVHNRLRFRVL